MSFRFCFHSYLILAFYIVKQYHRDDPSTSQHTPEVGDVSALIDKTCDVTTAKNTPQMTMRLFFLGDLGQICCYVVNGELIVLFYIESLGI